MKRFLMLLLCAATLLSLAGSSSALPNVRWHQYGTWSYPVVPRASFHTPPHVWLSPELVGNAPATYWNMAGINDGDQNTTPTWYVALDIDGVPTNIVVFNTIVPSQNFVAADRGPILVRGGRHLMSTRIDTADDMIESDETDNQWGRQFVWTPYVLGSSESVLRNQPPAPTGGWETLAAPAMGYNCDGFAFSSNLDWTAAVLHAVDPSADYDLHLFEPTPIWDDAFAVPLAGSTVGAGHLDFVMANKNQVAVNDYHVGVETYAGTGDFWMEEVHNWFMNIDDDYPTTMSAGEFMKIWELTILPGATGPLLMACDAAPGSDMRLAVFDQAFTVGGLLDAAAIHGSSSDGTLRFVHDFAVPGDYAVVVYRDPADGNGPVDFLLSVRSQAIDYTPMQLATWHSPLTPRPAADGTPSSVPLPAFLSGWAPSTYFNIAVSNEGPTAAGAVSTVIYRDGLINSPGSSFLYSAIGAIPEGGVVTMTNRGPVTVPGGRHTWTLEIDPNDSVYEVSESNNVWGEQYCWAPMTLGYGTQIDIMSVSNYLGGAATITSGEPFLWNCDGYRLAPSSGWWSAVAVIHDPADDYDLQLHDASTGPKNGFDTYQAGSSLVGGETDFVVVNRNIVGAINVDLGVTRYSGSPDYSLDVRQSFVVSDPSLSPIGPITMADGEMLNIYDMWLEPDVYAFQLDNISGSVDWGFELLPHNVAYTGRYNHMSGAAAFDNGAGVGEWFSVIVTEAGWYGLVVFKANVSSAPLVGSYRIRAGRGGTPVDEGEAPSAMAISGIHPNPFNPSTEIAFMLPVTGAVQLDIYDAKGALVRRLVDGALPAGRHTVAWDGDDDAGRRAASGVFVARMRSGGADVMHKMVMLK